jgi:signal peptidase I
MVDATPVETEPAERPATPGRKWLPGPRALLALGILALLIPAFVARLYQIPSDSMETTLHGCPRCDNDRVLVDKLSLRFAEPEAGDIVVFSVPNSWQNKELPKDAGGTEFIKRIIAVGGQTVSCCDARNRVIVDGHPLDEPYIHFGAELGPPEQAQFGPVQVPPEQLWVMGDNRNSSIDSRAANNGPVPVDDVIGKAQMIILPFHRFGGLDAPAQ